MVLISSGGGVCRYLRPTAIPTGVYCRGTGGGLAVTVDGGRVGAAVMSQAPGAAYTFRHVREALADAGLRVVIGAARDGYTFDRRMPTTAHGAGAADCSGAGSLGIDSAVLVCHWSAHPCASAWRRTGRISRRDRVAERRRGRTRRHALRPRSRRTLLPPGAEGTSEEESLTVSSPTPTTPRGHRRGRAGHGALDEDIGRALDVLQRIARAGPSRSASGGSAPVRSPHRRPDGRRHRKRSKRPCRAEGLPGGTRTPFGVCTSRRYGRRPGCAPLSRCWPRSSACRLDSARTGGQLSRHFAQVGRAHPGAPACRRILRKRSRGRHRAYHPNILVQVCHRRGEPRAALAAGGRGALAGLPPRGGRSRPAGARGSAGRRPGRSSARLPDVPALSDRRARRSGFGSGRCRGGDGACGNVPHPGGAICGARRGGPIISTAARSPIA